MLIMFTIQLTFMSYVLH